MMDGLAAVFGSKVEKEEGTKDLELRPEAGGQDDNNSNPKGDRRRGPKVEGQEIEI